MAKEEISSIDIIWNLHLLPCCFKVNLSAERMLTGDCDPAITEQPLINHAVMAIAIRTLRVHSPFIQGQRRSWLAGILSLVNANSLVTHPSRRRGECATTTIVDLCLRFSSSRSPTAHLMLLSIPRDILTEFSLRGTGLWAPSLVGDWHSSNPVVMVIMNAKRVLKL